MSSALSLHFRLSPDPPYWHALSRLPSPGPLSPYARSPLPLLAISSAFTRALFCLCSTTGPQPWFVHVEVIATGPGSGTIPLRETMQALPGLQMLILRAKLKRLHLHCPLLLHQKRFRLLSPHPGDIKPGWDLEPLLQCIKDHVGGPRPPSGLEHQARGSLRDLGSSRRLLQLIRVHRPYYHRLEDQAPHVHLRSDSRECGSACQRLPWGAIL